MLAKAKNLLRRATVALNNPYLSLRGKIAYVIERPWRWKRADLKHGWHVAFGSEEDRSTFEDVFIRESYRLLPCEGATVIDVGAHRGYFAVYALLKGATKVVALECDPSNAAAIEELVAANRISDSLLLVPKAAWSNTGTMQLKLSDENWAHSLTRQGSAGTTLDVPCTTLVEVVASLPRVGPIVVKSNCEGAETEVFRVVPREVTAMIIQYHSWATETLEEFRRQLLAQGFSSTVQSANEEHVNLFLERGQSA